VGETVAIAGSLELHVTVRPVSALPRPSLTVAAIVFCTPTAKLLYGLVNVIVATVGAMTVTFAVPLVPPAVAVIVTGPPTATPTTSPVAETLATAGFELVQLVVRPEQFCCVTEAFRVTDAPTSIELGGDDTLTADTLHVAGAELSLPEHAAVRRTALDVSAMSDRWRRLRIRSPCWN